VKPGINRNDVYALKIFLPELNEQRRIVTYLSETLKGINTVIANAESKLIYLEELKQAVMSKALFRGLTEDTKNAAATWAAE
jgi:type I restriction enzyme S subunit